LADLLGKVEDETTKHSVMSIAEQLIQEGREQGLEKGLLAGRIQMCQELLRAPVSTTEDLGQKSAEQLRALLRDLEARVRQRVPGTPSS
jgi:hypothetical protein